MAGVGPGIGVPGKLVETPVLGADAAFLMPATRKAAAGFWPM